MSQKLDYTLPWTFLYDGNYFWFKATRLIFEKKGFHLNYNSNPEVIWNFQRSSVFGPSWLFHKNDWKNSDFLPTGFSDTLTMGWIFISYLDGMGEALKQY
jgi:hypothetical protein